MPNSQSMWKRVPASNLSRLHRLMQQALAGLFCFAAATHAPLAAAELPPGAEPAPAAQPAAAITTSPVPPADGRQWLELMRQALTERNYSLSLVVADDQQMEPVQLLHGVTSHGQATLINYLNGPPRQVVRLANQVSYFEADGEAYSLRARRVAGPLPPAFFGDIGALAKSYDFVMAGRNRAAGRPVQLVRLAARDELRFSALLWLDEASGLLLRLDLFTPAGQPVEQVQVVHLALHDGPDPALQALEPTALPPLVTGPPPLRVDGTEGLRWSLGWLPSGFEVRYHDRHRLAQTNDPVDYYLLSDGLVELSVYIQPEPERRDSPQVAARGATGIVTGWHNGIEVAAVGRLPVDTLGRVVEGVLAGLTPAASGPAR